MEFVKMGIIGIGNMGTTHAKSITDGLVPGMKLVAIADRDPNRRKWAEQNLPESVTIFEEGDDLIDSGICDAVIIATPHYQHPVLAIKAMKKGLHVMCEKPAGVYTKAVREMNEVASQCDVTFAMMFNQRTNCVFRGGGGGGKCGSWSRAANTARSNGSTGLSRPGIVPRHTMTPEPGERPGQEKAAAYCSTSARTTSTFCSGFAECPAR